ncbi:MAG: beta-1,6-N-acetylglucosaminyltransferase [Candidatus Gracilibacteria bacterium]|nr:beta-1,6-N-acetylglucosaminyltransferase [Candidatus Gracilibacteria bacterium]
MIAKTKNISGIKDENLNKEITIAYLILVHRLPKQFKRLFKSIYNPNNYYLIHIDKKASKDLHKEITNFINDFENTYILESESIVWGGYSMVNVELNGIKKLLGLGLNWDFFINLSGQDYPVKSQNDINIFLKENRENNYIKVSNQITERPDTMNRIENYFIDNGNYINEIKNEKRDFLEDTIPYIGGQWMILNRKCCEFICNSLETKKYEDYYINTLIPDESYFQTLLMNSSFDGNIINDDKRSIIWVNDGDIKLRPKTFTKEDINFLSLENNLFARKFDDNEDSEIIDFIKENFNKKIIA